MAKNPTGKRKEDTKIFPVNFPLLKMVAIQTEAAQKVAIIGSGPMAQGKLNDDIHFSIVLATWVVAQTPT